MEFSRAQMQVLESIQQQSAIEGIDAIHEDAGAARGGNEEDDKPPASKTEGGKEQARIADKRDEEKGEMDEETGDGGNLPSQ